MANLWDEVNIYMYVYVCVCGGEGVAGGVNYRMKRFIGRGTWMRKIIYIAKLNSNFKHGKVCHHRWLHIRTLCKITFILNVFVSHNSFICKCAIKFLSYYPSIANQCSYKVVLGESLKGPNQLYVQGLVYWVCLGEGNSQLHIKVCPFTQLFYFSSLVVTTQLG